MSGPDLLLYNRKNFQWDGKLRVKREYQQQDVRLRQFNLYREDIRDLMELTCGKMDVILILDCLMLEFTILCLIKGHYRSLQWLLWLEFMSLTSAFLLLIVSAYLAMHCSVAAHSFSVRLLTQFVRLPIATSTEIDNAVAKAKDFEKSSNIFRLPFIAEQARAAMNQYAEVFEKGIVDVSSLDHVKLFRRMQANFMAYDAYARAGLALGTNQLLYGLYYKILGLSFLEDHSLVLAFGSAAAFAMCAVQVKTLDLKMPGAWNAISHVAMLAPLVAASILMALRAYAFHQLLLPIIFALHVAWVSILLFLLKPDSKMDIQLPTKFRQVLFLDVFGFTGKSNEESPIDPSEHNNAAEAPAVNIGLSSAPVPPIPHPRRSPSFPSSAPTRARSSSAPNPIGGPASSTDAPFSPFGAPNTSTITAAQLVLPVPEGLSETRSLRSRSRSPQPPSTPELRDAGGNTNEVIHYQFAESLESLSDNVLAYLGQNVKREFPEFFKASVKLQNEIQEWKNDNGMPQRRISFEMLCAGELERTVSSVTLADGDGWICCPADPSAYYFHCATGKTADSLPRGAQVIPSLDDLHAKWLDVLSMWKQLVGQSFSRSAEEDNKRAKEKASEVHHRLRSSVDDEKEGLLAHEERFGGQERLHSSFQCASVAVDHTIGIGATFHPEEVEVTPQGNTVPGMIPWRLFLHALLTLLFLWTIGTVWSFVHFVLGQHVFYPPFLEWTRETLPASDLCRTDVTSGVVSEFGHIVTNGNWSVASASDDWKALGTASSIHVGRTWLQAAQNAPAMARNASSLAIGRDKMWTLTRPSLITVYELPSVQPVWDFRVPHDVAHIFSIKNSLGIIRTSNAGCSARVLNSDGDSESNEYRLPMVGCSCRPQVSSDEL
eukprot:GEMP01010207.1.p1 GENE.GEMP01010207.1~~GEMP01010207.1.p1  ORF type:complete len:887 (+),score=149.16 GEMP01010207.1:64-2724(+)